MSVVHSHLRFDLIECSSHHITFNSKLPRSSFEFDLSFDVSSLSWIVFGDRDEEVSFYKTQVIFFFCMSLSPNSIHA
ncbi:hypothetical protein KFK09_008446 [Dendrobium nobile]|uniref:Uncharacterized protein n=1 Tax=Dendrobium nobile TaxID=94219 RepID=A0A8T3BMR9_DENNO|nr:hypothetical protein KFK09_008446 [Dendrobium nobile]